MPSPLLVPIKVNSQEVSNRVLAGADQRADATHFTEFMLCALRDAVREAVATDQVTDQVEVLIRAIGDSEPGSNELMKALGLTRCPTFRRNYLNPAL